MKSRFRLPYDLSGEKNAILLNTIEATSGNQTLQVRIPQMMPEIPGGAPTIKNLPVKGYSIYKSESTPPKMTKPVLQEKNYFETSKNMQTTVSDLNKETDLIMEELDETIAKYSSVNKLTSVRRERKLSYKVPAGTPLRVEFLNGNLNQLSFTLQEQSNGQKTLEKGGWT